MRDKIINIDPARREVSELIAEAKDLNFDEVHLVGLKDGKVYFKTSYFKNALETIGALESLKNILLKDW